MRIYIGFDDTDTVDIDRGTGRLARMFEQNLPKDVHVYGVLRQQLPVLDGIPYTSHNSSACVIVDADDTSIIDEIIDRASYHLEEHFIDGSDPGLCVVAGDSPRCADIVAFGLTCCRRIVTQDEARTAAGAEHLSGHGGTNDGIIGALAGVGLTMYGWTGRFIEFGRLRDITSVISVGDLADKGIVVVGIDHDAMTPSPEDTVDTGGWLRPRLWAHRPVLPVESAGVGMWRVTRRNKSDPSAHVRTMERS